MKGTGVVGAVTAGLRGRTVYLPPRGRYVRLAIVASMLAADYDAAGMNKIMSLAKDAVAARTRVAEPRLAARAVAMLWCRVIKRSGGMKCR